MACTLCFRLLFVQESWRNQKEFIGNAIYLLAMRGETKNFSCSRFEWKQFHRKGVFHDSINPPNVKERNLEMLFAFILSSFIANTSQQ
jgi:hypothetical protein